MKYCFRFLDLSFNNIEVIDGLSHLTELEDLTLFNNRINRIENMDSLTKLQVLSLGNNKLTEIEDVSSPLYFFASKLLSQKL